jgi:hypothetical protein
MQPLPLEPPLHTTGAPPLPHPDGFCAPPAGDDGVPVIRETRTLYGLEGAKGEPAYVHCFEAADGSIRCYAAIADDWMHPRRYAAEPYLLAHWEQIYAGVPALPAFAPLPPEDRAGVMAAFAVLTPETRERAWQATTEIRERTTADGLLRMVTSYDYRGRPVRRVFLQQMADGTAAIFPVADEAAVIEEFTTPQERAEDAESEALSAEIMGA